MMVYFNQNYGENWMIPKKIGYEKDVLDLIPEAPLPGRAGRLKQLFIKHVMPWRTSRIRILNHKGEPVSGADVVVVGLGRSKSNDQRVKVFVGQVDPGVSLSIRFEIKGKIIPFFFWNNIHQVDLYFNRVRIVRKVKSF